MSQPKQNQSVHMQEAEALIVQGIEQGVGVGYGLEAASALTPPGPPSLSSMPQEKREG